VYRAAWSHEAALALLREESGSAFDERCVAALERVLGWEQMQPVTPVFQVAAAAV
jgi:HD-GYP domain-containing protein (c-di-GMP phosphodiesterase class II)